MKKTHAVLLAIFAAVLYFDIDTVRLSNNIYLYITDGYHEEVPPAGVVTPTTLSLSGKTINMGDDFSTITETFGESMDSFSSEYGFAWNIYHNNYKDYVQIGVNSQDKVCAAYTNSRAFRFCGIRVGSTIDEVRMTFGEPLTAIRKGNIDYVINTGVDSRREIDVFLFRGMYLRFFYDCFKNNTVTSIHIIEEDTELSFARQYADGTADRAYAMELENFYITNALRVREGVSAVEMSNFARTSALAHAEDMAKNQYFSHTGLDGSDILMRLKRTGVPFRQVAENLAAGGQSSIIMHELLMNSAGHRQNILGRYRYLGVGVAFDENNRPYLVQNYFNPLAG